jgi:DNA-3-methyladenine glycosylase
MPYSHRLSTSFFARDTHRVARQLLGKLLVRELSGQKLIGRLTEVESYVGVDDLACHASKGRTPRTEVMFGPPGHAYVYLIYGLHHCFNIVTDQTGFPAAVLIRGLEPVAGFTGLANGPGKLTKALNITRELNRENLATSPLLYLADDGFTVNPQDIQTSPRIGVDYAGPCALYPWRYFL